MFLLLNTFSMVKKREIVTLSKMTSSETVNLIKTTNGVFYLWHEKLQGLLGAPEVLWDEEQD
jgi:hypothetical protein